MAWSACTTPTREVRARPAASTRRLPINSRWAKRATTSEAVCVRERLAGVESLAESLVHDRAQVTTDEAVGAGCQVLKVERVPLAFRHAGALQQQGPDLGALLHVRKVDPEDVGEAFEQAFRKMIRWPGRRCCPCRG